MIETPARLRTVADCRALLHAGRLALLTVGDRELAAAAHPQFLLSLYPHLGHWEYLADALRETLTREVETSYGSYILSDRWYSKSVARSTEYSYTSGLVNFDTVVIDHYRKQGAMSAPSMTHTRFRSHANAAEQVIFGNEVDPDHLDLLIVIDNIYSGLWLLCEPAMTDDGLLVTGLEKLGDRFFDVLAERVGLVTWFLREYPAVHAGFNNAAPKQRSGV